MLVRTMSTNILRVNRSLLMPVGAVNYCNFELFSKQFGCSPRLTQYNHRHCINFGQISQSMFRTIFSRPCLRQNKLQKSADTNSETESTHSEIKTSQSSFPRTSNEEEFYHKVLERSNAYSGTIYKEDPNFLETYNFSDKKYKNLVETKSWHDKSPSHIIITFISAGVYAYNKPHRPMTIEDQQFEPLISALVDSLKLSTDEQLIDCFISLKYWPLCDRVKDPHIHKVWKALDDVCLQRYLDWTVDKCLFMMDLWYHLGLARNSYFVYKALNKISRKTEEFTAAQMIQSLFYMICKKNINPAIALREYEYHIQQHITKLSIEEIGIFALAFFKTKTSILNKKVLMYIMQRIVTEVDTIDSIVIASFAKVVRFSHKPDIGFTANDMVTKVIEKRWDSMSLIPALHLAHINTQIQFYNEDVLTKISEKFCKNPSAARLKDMERIAFFLSLYNFIPPTTPEVGRLIEEQLNLPLREHEAITHPLIFLSLLYFLSLLQVFPEKQIQRALDEKNLLNRYESKYMIPHQAVRLDYHRVLEGPPGSQYLLSPAMREYVARRYSMHIPSDKYPIKSQFDKMMYEIMKCSDVLLGKENVFVTYTLPHFPRADLLFRLDDKGNPLPIPEEMKKLSEFDDVHRPVGPGKWYAVMVCGRNMYMHNVPRLVGEQATKLRQLQVLGYTPIQIPSYFWTKEEDKLAYLKLKYFSSYEGVI